ncbi:MAG: mRNA-degrading endonuclease [Planctomycetaceae bacterium]|nr:mRNA-degrading endonuclease [Planctomycetaceae bacterium]
MTPVPELPDRGHLVWVSLDPQAGHEQAGRRPALVVSPASYNGPVGLALFCPITGQAKGYPFEVALPSGLAVSGVVLADHVKSLDWRARRAEYAGTAPDAVVDEVVRRLVLLLGSNPSEAAVPPAPIG